MKASMMEEKCIQTQKVIIEQNKTHQKLSLALSTTHIH